MSVDGTSESTKNSLRNPSLVRSFHKESQYDDQPVMIQDYSFLDVLVEHVLPDL